MIEATHIGFASRVHMRDARKAFEAGATVLVSERGHLEEIEVTSLTTVHTRETIAWSELVDMVTMWRNRYPDQRFYVVGVQS